AVIPPRDGAAAVLVVAPVEGATLTAVEVLRELATLLEDFKVPPRCTVVDTSPLGANGKVDKRALPGRLDGPVEAAGVR
ncbi:MAG: long-chain fatty acid--CoA ligase, partial [Frankia sp.]